MKPRLRAALLAHVIGAYVTGIIVITPDLIRNFQHSSWEVFVLVPIPLTLPVWLLADVAVLGSRITLYFIPASIAYVLLRRRFLENQREIRRATGLCRVCGYDLRATPDRCPECGTMVQQVSSK